MTSIDQKRREREVLNFYLQIIDVEGDVEYQERPDFIVTTSSQRIGVEITEYHQPRHSGDKFKRKSVEVEWQKIKTSELKYRDTQAGLENLNVRLSFINLALPPQNRHQEFIRAVHDEISRVMPAGVTTIRINEQHPSVIRKYLNTIDVELVNCYMEWDWNHTVAWVGTSEDELIGILEAKLRLKRAKGIDQLHLVVAGNGPTGGTYIGYLDPEWLQSWTCLNEALSQSDYEVVAILNYQETCLWRRGQGWSPIVHP